MMCSVVKDFVSQKKKKDWDVRKFIDEDVYFNDNECHENRLVLRCEGWMYGKKCMRCSVWDMYEK